jgi:hypothetical protein
MRRGTEKLLFFQQAKRSYLPGELLTGRVYCHPSTRIGTQEAKELSRSYQNNRSATLFLDQKSSFLQFVMYTCTLALNWIRFTPYCFTNRTEPNRELTGKVTITLITRCRLSSSVTSLFHQLVSQFYSNTSDRRSQHFKLAFPFRFHSICKRTNECYV